MSGQPLTPRAPRSRRAAGRRRRQRTATPTSSSERRRQPLEDHRGHRLAVDRGEAEIEPHQPPADNCRAAPATRDRARRTCAARARVAASPPPICAISASTVSPGANCSSRNTPIRIRNRVGIEAASRRPARLKMRMGSSLRIQASGGKPKIVPADDPQRGVLEWLRALAVITVTKICSIGIQTGSSVFTSLTNSA